MVLGLTYLGSWFRDGDLSNKLERASHTAKDAGELAATIGAVISFSGIFFEAFLTHDLPHYFFSLPLWAIAGFYLDNSLELHEMQGRSVTQKSESDSSDLVR